MHVHSDGVSDKHNNAAGVGAAADRCGLPGVDVYGFRVDCAVPKGV